MHCFHRSPSATLKSPQAGCWSRKPESSHILHHLGRCHPDIGSKTEGREKKDCQHGNELHRSSFHFISLLPCMLSAAPKKKNSRRFTQRHHRGGQRTCPPGPPYPFSGLARPEAALGQDHPLRHLAPARTCELVCGFIHFDIFHHSHFCMFPVALGLLRVCPERFP